MIDVKRLPDKITDPLYDSMEIIEIIHDKHNMPISDLDQTELRDKDTASSLVELYSKTDGLHIKWCVKENDSIGGELQFNKHIWLLRDDQSLIDQCDMDPNLDERQRHFRVWDVPTMNTMVGFIYNSESGFSRSLYFYTQGAS